MPEVLEGLDLDQLAGDVLLRLRAEAGERFELIASEPGDWRPSVDADIAFRDRATGNAVLVEVRGSRTSGDLPLGMIPHIRRIKEAADPNEVVLVSLSPVSELVRRLLDQAHIRVVEADASSRTAPRLAAAILDSAR